MVLEITSRQEFEEYIKQNKCVIADFYATWCGPCKRITPLLQSLQEKYPDIQTCKVDVEELEYLTILYNVKAMPTLIAFYNENIVKRVVGSNENEITNLFESLSKHSLLHKKHDE